MPVVCAVGGEVVVVASVGNSALEEIRNAIQGAVVESKYRLGMPVLLDGRYSTMAISDDGFRQLVACFACFVDPFQILRIALLTSDDRRPVAERFARALAAVGILGQVFTDSVSATRWLGVGEYLGT